MAGAQEAVFHIPDSHGLASLAAFGAGFSGAFGVPATEAAGVVANLPSKRSKLPHSVLLRVDEELGIALFAVQPNGQEGALLLEAGCGQFGAALHRNFGEIQLLLTFTGQATVDLRGKWNPLVLQPMRVARAAIAVARKA